MSSEPEPHVPNPSSEFDTSDTPDPGDAPPDTPLEEQDDGASESDAEALVVEESAEAPRPKAEPVTPAARIGSVDVLRGVALMGILAMNINAFGWPFQVYQNPTAMPNAGPLDIVLWAFNHIVFDTKMMTLFSMLFGAGLVLMDARAEARGARIRGVYFSRTFWLLVIGMVHAYLIWDGDILVGYAQCGFVLYFFRKKSPKTLLILGTCLILLAVPLLLGFRSAVHYAGRVAPEVEAKLRLDIPQSSFRVWIADKWAKVRQDPKREREKFEENIKIHRGTYPEIMADRFWDQLMTHTFGFIFGMVWLVGGRMLVGMGLMKLGVFTAERSWRFYAWMTAIGYGIGLPLMAIDTYLTIEYAWSFLKYELEGGMLLNMVGGVIVVLGHIGLVMMICKGGLLKGLTDRLGAAGRMALSNYLFDSLVCTTLFYGYGFGLYGKLDRGRLYLVVLAIWAFQLWFSPIWLRHFRYGPAEWVWRSLTYGRFQSMRYPVEPPAPPPAVEEATAEPVLVAAESTQP